MTAPPAPRHHAGRGKHGAGGCACAAEALPPACPAETETEACPLPALCPNVPDVAACGGGGLFGAMRWRGAGWRWRRSGQAGGWAGVRTRPPPHASPSLPPTAPQTEGGARNAPRPAIMLRFHPRFLTVLIPVPTDMNKVFRWIENKLVKIKTHLNRLVNYIHLLRGVSLNMDICCLS